MFLLICAACGALDGSARRGTPLGAASRYVGALTWPLPFSEPRISSRFGKRGWRFHEGLDLRAGRGTPILAAHDGTVLVSGPLLRGYGSMVVIRSEGLMTIYAHASRTLLAVGDSVRAGDEIAEVGDTGNASGPHLHFETRVVTPVGYVAVDPLVFYPDVRP